MKHSFSWTDEKTENVIGNLLRAGVLLSAVVVMAGGLLYLYHSGRQRHDYHTFRGQPDSLRSISGVVHQAAALDSSGIMQLGLLLLILTPIARVVFSAVAFALEGDSTYVVVTLMVLAVLVYSLLGGP